MKKFLRKPKKSATSGMVMAYIGENTGIALLCGYNF